MNEQSVVLVKPDGVKRGLVGKIISRFEEAGLKLVAMKMIWVDEDHVGKHYSDDPANLKVMGDKTLETYAKYGKDANETLGTDDPEKIGAMIRKWNMEFLSSGPVLAIILEGVHAVSTVRKIVGSTLPYSAEPGSIRGTYSIDSPALANEKMRSVRNLIHASGNVEEAEFEVKLWFHENEIYAYKRVDEEVMFD
ncbi:nucleoside-diphosphate kinase [candidate division WWE3 bacterium]|uniref:nucleoside-diphosphate kinase n=1 Tax=candidate division WWE3 bacterium TaxID=2053526 RepID=A0A955LKD6_UNCKA|nr:nucleoside-diphosphate kinase [candidate division WWE3 bacterium]